jgi:hypothetical protein
MAQLQPSSIGRVLADSKKEGVTPKDEQKITHDVHGIALSSIKRASARISQHSTIAEDPTSQSKPAVPGKSVLLSHVFSAESFARLLSRCQCCYVD